MRVASICQTGDGTDPATGDTETLFHEVMEMQLRWVSRGTVYAIIDGRTLRISGEALLEGDPDFLIYPQYMNQWEDGSTLPEEAKSRILADVVAEAAKLGWIFEVEQENAQERTPWKYRKA